jgi:hypothetical protein
MRHDYYLTNVEYLIHASFMFSEFYIFVRNIFCFILLRCMHCPTHWSVMEDITVRWYKLPFLGEKIEMLTTVGEIDYSL